MWRATFSELARWWRWRAERRWLAFPREDHRLEIQFDEWDAEYAFALEIHRGRFHCSLPVTGPRMSLGLAGLVYERERVVGRLAWMPPRSVDADIELETCHADRARLGDRDAAGDRSRGLRSPIDSSAA